MAQTEPQQIENADTKTVVADVEQGENSNIIGKNNVARSIDELNADLETLADMAAGKLIDSANNVAEDDLQENGLTNQSSYSTIESGGENYAGTGQDGNSSERLGRGVSVGEETPGAVQGTDGRVYSNGQGVGNATGTFEILSNSKNNRGLVRNLTTEEKGKLKETAIVNDDGSPKLVSHFTDNMDFETFGEGDIGFHFGNESQAITRGRKKNVQGRIIRAYLNIKNPIRIGTDIMNWQPNAVALKLFSDGILSFDESTLIHNTQMQSGKGYNSPAAVELRKMLAQKGYDGIVYNNFFEGDGESYIAFYPEQVIIVDNGINQDSKAAFNDGAFFVAETDSAFTEPSASSPKDATPLQRAVGEMYGNPVLTEDQKTIKSIGKKLGWKIQFDNVYVKDAQGNYVLDAKGRRIRANADIDFKNRTITIDFNCKKPIQFLFKHELTDYISQNRAVFFDLMNTVMDSGMFNEWVKSKGYASAQDMVEDVIQQRTAAGDPNFVGKRQNDLEIEASIEITSDFIGENCFGGKNSLDGLLESLQPEQRKNFIQRILDFLRSIRDRIAGNKTLEDDIARIEKQFVKAYKAVEVSQQQKNTDQKGGVRYSFEGYAEDGKGKYKANFPKGTPKTAKAEKILRYIQNVWSKKPIRLKIKENGEIRYIQAQFDPTYDETGNMLTDASKIMGGNRHGTASEQRVTLDLADDYYQIASEAEYNYSKDETGKDNPVHEGVKKWHYFINDIYFAEYDSDDYQPYRVSINVKERADGEFVYSFSAEKQNKLDTPQTLHAVVNEGNDSNANAQLYDNMITQNEPIVNNEYMQENKRYSITPETQLDLFEKFKSGELSEDEYRRIISSEKVLNPNEIANLTEKDANTTPKLEKQKGVNKGNKQSKTYGSLLGSSIFDDTFKDEIKDDTYIKRYQSVTNKETLAKAAKELDEGGEAYVQRWKNLDAEHASLIDIAVGLILMDRYKNTRYYTTVYNG